MRITCRQISKRIAKDHSPWDLFPHRSVALLPSQIEAILEYAFKMIREELVQGNRIILPKIGGLHARETRARHYRHPMTGVTGQSPGGNKTLAITTSWELKKIWKK